MFQIVVKLGTWPSYSSDLFTIKCMFILKHFSKLACEAALYLEVFETRRCMAHAWGVCDLWIMLETLRPCFVLFLTIVVVLRFGTNILCCLFRNLVI
jgi:hypothetical protein